MRINNEALWLEYAQGKQTYKQLAAVYKVSSKTIQRHLDKVQPGKTAIVARPVVVVMDTTYFGSALAIMLFKDAYTGDNLYKMYVKYETNELYKKGINYLLDKGFTIKAIVCDGRKGLLKAFDGIPVQLCQFHQIAIITRYLTRNPKYAAAIELRQITLLLTKTDKESFSGALQQWHTKWENFLNERNTDDQAKSYYTHKRLRSAYRSLHTNLPWLFCWYDHIELKIPNTTNLIDGHFADLKNKLRNHNGLSMKRKMKFIDEFFKL